MKAEETIQGLFDRYPLIYQHRTEVLDFLFCVIGTGFNWINGELVFYDENELMTPINPLRDGKACQYCVDHKYDRILDRNNHNNSTSHHWYGVSDGCHLLTPPEDIKPDWKILRKECLELLAKDGLVIISDDGNLLSWREDGPNETVKKETSTEIDA